MLLPMCRVRDPFHAIHTVFYYIFSFSTDRRKINSYAPETCLFLLFSVKFRNPAPTPESTAREDDLIGLAALT